MNNTASTEDDGCFKLASCNGRTGLMPEERGLHKRQKRRLMACYFPNCFHPATTGVMVGDEAVWSCKCHDPVNPMPCRETLEREERRHFVANGDCVFCGASKAGNPVHGLEGKLSFVCDKCIVTPMGELRRYWRA